MFDTAVPAMLKTHKRNIFTCEIMRFSFKSVQLNKTQKDMQLFDLIIIDSRIFFCTSTFICLKLLLKSYVTNNLWAELSQQFCWLSSAREGPNSNIFISYCFDKLNDIIFLTKRKFLLSWTLWLQVLITNFENENIAIIFLLKGYVMLSLERSDEQMLPTACPRP